MVHRTRHLKLNIRVVTIAIKYSCNRSGFRKSYRIHKQNTGKSNLTLNYYIVIIK